MRDRVECAGANRRNTDVRREPAVRVDLMRWKGQDRSLGAGCGQPLERGEKKRHVRAGLLELAVVRNDVEDHRIWLSLGRRRDEQRLCRTGQSRDNACRHIHAAARDRSLQNGAEVQ